MASILGIY